jgi:hypothetical protein
MSSSVPLDDPKGVGRFTLDDPKGSADSPDAIVCCELCVVSLGGVGRPPSRGAPCEVACGRWNIWELCSFMVHRIRLAAG